MNPENPSRKTRAVLEELGVGAESLSGGLDVRSPIDGSVVARVRRHDRGELDRIIAAAEAAFRSWRSVPAPRRGELVRLYADELRRNKAALGRLISIEAGKITEEGQGEVQEMIDICDFAVGLSRQLYGRVIASERAGHKMLESWHPLGPVGIVTAFNFPVAVWSWNAALALVCGDSIVWKPSDKTPLCALACNALLARAMEKFGDAPTGLSQVAIGGAELAEALAEDRRVPLVSATGSTRMGAALGPRITGRFGRALLELGGNNGMIVAPSADLDLALRAILFAAVGTAGQRCTTLRRLFVHGSVADKLVGQLHRAYEQVRIGNPLEPGTLVGPLIGEGAYRAMQRALDEARSEGARVLGGDRVLADQYPDAYYVQPAIVEIDRQCSVVRRETFAPILYVMRYNDLADAIAAHNDVPQGLASSIFTTDLREAEQFTAAEGGDCGIVNVNIGPSGAEIGGAFGGEKETGGGREAGSDSWKAYMRRMTTTINYSRALPLAQGIRFEIEAQP
ncbi:MAG TPA: aldehyde dehydrogenase family protein [Stellaceae bacterium]